MRKAIIIGASSGIGRELARVLSLNGYMVGITGRRLDLLTELQAELQNTVLVRRIDVTQRAEAMRLLDELIAEMKGVDLIVISAGTGFINPELEWEKEESTIEVNVAGFAALANVAASHFLRQGSGHLVGISSIAALRGGGAAPAYNASKAFVSNYLEGLRQRFTRLKSPVIVTDIQPGLVKTAMAQGEVLFWVAPPEKAARQIFAAIKRQRKHAYVTKRWRLIAWLLKALPDVIYRRF